MSRAPTSASTEIYGGFDIATAKGRPPRPAGCCGRDRHVGAVQLGVDASEGERVVIDIGRFYEVCNL
jgi:hypothetical protein